MIDTMIRGYDTKQQLNYEVMLQYSNIPHQKNHTPLRRIFRKKQSGIATHTRPDFDGTPEPRTFLEFDLGCLYEAPKYFMRLLIRGTGLSQLHCVSPIN